MEKDFLREKGVVTETQSDLGKLFNTYNDSNNIMFTNYTLIYKLYSVCLTRAPGM